MSLQDPSHKPSIPPTEHHVRKRPVSERRIQANRSNALRSTGPKTDRGKRTVSRNAIKHGFLAREVVITAGDGEENLEEFHALIERLSNCYEPVGIVEETQVQIIATTLWRKARVFVPKMAKYASALTPNPWTGYWKIPTRLIWT